MKQYIEKDRILAEIEKRINKEIQSCATDNCFGYSQGCVDSMRNILSFLNTLEVKELPTWKKSTLPHNNVTGFNSDYFTHDGYYINYKELFEVLPKDE